MLFQGSSFSGLDLNLLATLVAVVEERSTVAAAQRLHLAQSTISGSLAKLRVIFKDELLVRNGRNLEPTTRALELLDAAKPHIEALVQAVTTVLPFDPKADQRVFRFGCTDAVALTLLPLLIPKLRERAPLCDIVVRLGDFRALPGMLSSGEVSSALAFFRDAPPATAKIKALLHSPWVVVRDARLPPVAGIDDYCERAHALVTPVGDLSGFVDQQLESIGRKRRVAVGVTSFAMLIGVLPGSDLVATVPDFVGYQLAKLGFAVEPSPIAIPTITNSLCWRAAMDRDPAEKWFRALVTECFLQTLPEG
jgi:LysR family transcriptional regulator, mexEF-oprN operon transcriptional activator